MSNKDGIWTPLLEMLILGHFAMALLHNFYFVLCQNPMAGYGPQNIFHRICDLWTNIDFSPALVLRQRNFQFAILVFGFEACVIGAAFWSDFCSMASQQFSLMQFSLRWPVSLQYQHYNSGFRHPLVPGASWDSLGFPR